jgi:cobalt-zinc-cadmium efflux system membrane fusion protein
MKNVTIISLLLIVWFSASSADLHASGNTHPHPDGVETCFICDPAKRDAGRLWCRGHARYEDRCWLCHPELEDKDRPYCEEHYLFEDECFLCHPELAAGDPQEDHSDHDDHAGHDHGPGDHGPGRGLFCNEHGVAEIECGICQPQLAATLSPGESLKVRMPSEESAGRAGIETREVESRQGRPVVESLCEMQYNLNALARVTPFADGIILHVLRDVGDVVRAGDVLAELHSAELADAKSAFLSASVQADIQHKNFEREKRLLEQKIAAEQDYLQAEAAFRTAHLAASNQRQRLINLGLTVEEIEAVSASLDTSATLLVRAPFDGTIVERSAVMGEAAETGEPLFTVADLSTFWLALSIPADFAAKVQPGQPVEARFPELPGEIIRGRINWIDTSVDPRSRMIRARAVVEDRGTPFRSGMYGEARIGTDSLRPMSLLPQDAVQQHEGRHFVFVKEAADLFSLRRVLLGESLEDSVEVAAGLAPHEAVVVEGGFVVMSEFLKSRMGAGCAGH